LDNVALAYAYIDPEIIPIGANVIDGSGNDIYIGHVPSAREYQRQHLSFPWALIGLLDALWESHNPLRYQLRRLLKARAEHASLEGGHSRRTVNQMIPHAVEPYSDLSAIEASSPQKDYLSFRAAVRGRLTDQEMFTRKVRNASDVFGWNLILPWAEQATACHIFSMNEHDLFDRDTLRSKLPLREGLYRNIGLNSDDLGKRFFNFNAWENCAALDDSWQLDWASSPVLSAGAGRVLSDLRQAASRARGPRGGMLRQLYSRTFQLMAWLTINEYVQVSKATAAR
jgi:asparagine synthase (glutamine-hydrolysing)